MEHLYRLVKKKLSKIDFEALYPAFHVFPFALYDDKTVMTDEGPIEKTGQFFGNTAITFNNKLTAIWNIEASPIEDVDRLTSLIVHEMFHAFQKEKNEKRWPNEIQALFIPLESENMGLKYQENQILVDAYKHKDKTFFDTFLRNRKARHKRYEASVRYEQGVEVIEGMAQYVEWACLKQLAPSQFEQGVKRALNRLKDKNNYRQVRHISYDSGTLLCALMDIFDITWKTPLGTSNDTIAAMLLTNIEPSVETLTPDSTVMEMVDETLKKRKKTLYRLLENCETVKGKFTLLGLDPMNAFQVDNKVYNPKFFAYQDNGDPVYVQGPSVVELDDDLNVRKIHTKPTSKG